MKINRFLTLAIMLISLIGLFSFTSNEEASITSKGELFAAPCKMKVINGTSSLQGVSVNSRNASVRPNSSVTKGCPCSGYVQLYTPGPVTWQLIDNRSGSPTQNQVVLSGGLSGVFDLDNYHFE